MAELSELPESLQEELEILRAIYGEETVRLLKDRRIQEDGEEPVCCLEVDLEPMSEEGFQLVWVTLLVTVPKGYPLTATPKIEVGRPEP
ncbi:unnamed protein product [Symbiodinium natans]|uniref:RWD domain-containing protein n=1 Tax=Symbiodinium natans TaxID=878477 RepID=A0A812HW52_9DINO|nr:unnamed protein product [Symbiodinium natans]